MWGDTIMKKFVALAALMAAAALPAQAQVTNGDFETPGTYTGLYLTSLPGWQLTPGGTWSVHTANSTAYNGVGGLNSTGTGTFVAFNAGDSVPGGSISQSFALAAGTYDLSFLFGAFGGSGGSQSLSYLLTDTSGTLLSGTINAGATIDLATLFGSNSFNFYTAGGPVTLTFTDASSSTSSIDGFLDSVAISAVPETGTWAMMLLGFGMLGGTLRRRRAKPAIA